MKQMPSFLSTAALSKPAASSTLSPASVGPGSSTDDGVASPDPGLLGITKGTGTCGKGFGLNFGAKGLRFQV